MTINRSPMTAKQALDLYFPDNRARLLEIASFLDRVGRYENSADVAADYRYCAFVKALKIILDTKQNRTAEVHRLFSDTTEEPVDRVTDGKAYGAWKGADLEDY